ncbi:unnamed protein product, partial [Sphacelaria rigidula]
VPAQREISLKTRAFTARLTRSTHVVLLRHNPSYLSGHEKASTLHCQVSVPPAINKCILASHLGHPVQMVALKLMPGEKGRGSNQLAWVHRRDGVLARFWGFPEAATFGVRGRL